MPDYLNPEGEGRQEIELVTPSALAIITRSEFEVAMQIASLPQNRRKISEFQREATGLVKTSQVVATQMSYSLMRGGKAITGPSARFAEALILCWRNCVVVSRMIGESATHVTAQGNWVDLQNNTRTTVEVMRRITDKNGNRYNEDMVTMVSMAAMSIARRNVAFSAIPQAIWMPVYEEARLIAIGKDASHADRVADAMKYLQELGVTEWQILGAVGVTSSQYLEADHLHTLRVLYQEIKGGEKSIDEVFATPFDDELNALFTQLKMNPGSQATIKKSYAGRVEELVAYLRERVKPAARTANVQPVTEPARAATKSDDKPGNRTIPDDFNRVVPAAKNAERTVVVDAPDGGTSSATVVSGGTGEQENLTIPDDNTLIGEPVRRRGRSPSRIGRAAQPQPEPSEQEARQEVEAMVGQTDQFAF